MVRKAGMLFAGVLGLVLCVGGQAEEKKDPSIKDVMKAVAGKKGAPGLCGKCAAAGKGKKWDDAQKLAKDLAQCCEALTKCPCPKGDAESWKKLTKQYADQSAAVAKAADDKDGKAFNAAVGAFTKSCKGCHDAHK